MRQVRHLLRVFWTRNALFTTSPRGPAAQTSGPRWSVTALWVRRGRWRGSQAGMIGRDYASWGSRRHVAARFGDNRGNPFPGPCGVHFMTPRHRLLAWNRMGSVYIMNMMGVVESCVHPLASRPQIERKLANDPDEFFDDTDWQTKFLTADQNTATSEARTRHFYLDLMPLAAVPLPGSELLAVADMKLKIKLVNLESMSIVSTFGSAGSDPGCFSAPTALEAVRVGREHIILVGDSGANQRVMAFSSRGRLLAHIGEKGPMLGQFRDIACLSAFVDRSAYSVQHLPLDADLFVHAYMPPWFRGTASSLEALEDDLFAPWLAGNFVIGARPHEHRAFDLLVRPSSQRVQRLVVKQLDSGGFYIANRAIGGELVTYPSMFSLVRAEPTLRFVDEVRDSLVVAATDRLNFRVQVLRLFWTDTDLFAPTLDVLLALGGPRNAQGVTLRDPVAAQFSPTRELAVCDLGAQAVLLLSPAFQLIKVIALPFLSARDVLALGQRRRDQRFAPTAREVEASKQPCWVAFRGTGVDPGQGLEQGPGLVLGQMALAYASGGVYLFEAKQRTASVGALSQLETRSLERVVSEFLSFADAEALRNCCWYLHNFTQELRFAFKLLPAQRRAAVGGGGVATRALTAFLRLSRSGADGGNALSGLELRDLQHRAVCRFHLQQQCHLPNCPLSHEPVAYDRYELQQSQAYLLEADVAAILTELYGPRLFFKFEAYLHELFECYARERTVLLRCDPMTRQYQTVRPTRAAEVAAVRFSGFLEIVLAVEEHVARCKDLTQHKLFSGRGRARFLPQVPTSLQALRQARGIVAPVADSMTQYDRPLGVPPVNRRVGLRIVTKAGFAADEHVRGPLESRLVVDRATSVQEHVAQVQLHATRARALMDKLFS